MQFPNSPNWTLKGRVQSFTSIISAITQSNQPANFPSPLDYSADKPPAQRAATYAIGKQQREVFKVTETNPGPGTYEIPSKIQQGPKKSFGLKFESAIQKSPGPQQYSADYFKSKPRQPAYSMSSKSKSYRQMMADKNQYQPPPTSYQIKGTFNNPKGIFGSSTRKDLDQHEKTPGPANYLTLEQLDKNKSISSKNAPRYGFGSSQRINQAKSFINPGPGNYQIKTQTQFNQTHKKGFSLRPKTTNLEMLEKAKIPGPGSYDIQLNNLPKAPQIGILSSKRMTFIDEVKKNYKQLPPPGIHNPSSDAKFRNTISFKFSNSNRRPLDQHEYTPGPATYTNTFGKTSTTDAPKYSIAKNSQKLDQFLLKKDETPGPNHYDPSTRLIDPSIKGSQLTRERKLSEIRHDVPGPGTYNPTIQKPRGPTWKINSSDRKTSNE